MIDVANGNNVLVTFDSIVDTDIGLLKFMKEKYNNPKFSYINNYDNIDDLKKILIERDNKNPLGIVLKDEYIENMDTLYDEFMSKYYKDIITYSKPTGIINAVKTFLLSNGVIRVTVLCKNEYEEQYIRKQAIQNLNIIREENFKNLDLSVYDTIIIKNIYDVFLFKKVEGKNLMVCKYRFNLDKENFNRLIPVQEILLLYGDINRIHIIDVYDEDELFEPCG